MSNRLIIIGAGGFGREVYNWILDGGVGNGFSEIAFIDRDLDALKGFENYPPVISTIDEYSPESGDRLVLAIASPKIKSFIHSLIANKGGEFVSVIHPTVKIATNVSLGQGVIFCPYVIISCDSKIGDFVHINTASTIAHDVSIGDRTTISGHCDVTGGAIVSEDCFLGSSSVVAPKVVVEPYSVIGAGSVVLRKVKAGSTVMGVPAKRFL